MQLLQTIQIVQGEAKLAVAVPGKLLAHFFIGSAVVVLSEFRQLTPIHQHAKGSQIDRLFVEERVQQCGSGHQKVSQCLKGDQIQIVLLRPV